MHTAKAEAAEQFGRILAQESRERIAQREQDTRAAWDQGYEAGKDARFLCICIGAVSGACMVGFMWWLSSIVPA
jgi:hypothetical protein